MSQKKTELAILDKHAATDLILRTADDMMRAAPEDHDLVSAPILKLTQGMRITGFFCGEGPTMELAANEDGEVATLRTWELRNEDDTRRVRIVGTYQTNSVLPRVPVGTKLAIEHQGQTDTRKGRRVNNLAIYLPRDLKLA